MASAMHLGQARPGQAHDDRGNDDDCAGGCDRVVIRVLVGAWHLLDV
jgi:hypothetical protein